MATVIRLKRRIDEDPLNAFVLNCKRQRIVGDEAQNASQDSATPAETATVLKFAGTFTQPEGISSHLQRTSTSSKSEARKIISRVHRPNITSRNRTASRQSAQDNRFKIVNCTREIETGDAGTGPSMTIVDVEKDEGGASKVNDAPAADGAAVDSSLAAADDPNARYVYDLYVADSNQTDAHIPTDNLEDLSVAIYDDPLFSTHLDSDDSDGDESDDSNDENNWRNDYPDEEEEDEEHGGGSGRSSIADADMIRAVEELDLDGDRELSSDDEATVNRYLYTVPADEATGHDFEDDDDDDSSDGSGQQLDRMAVLQYGKAYARYRARALKYLEKQHPGGSSSDSGDDSDAERENFDLYD